MKETMSRLVEIYKSDKVTLSGGVYVSMQEIVDMLCHGWTISSATPLCGDGFGIIVYILVKE